jgi:hypothetical protein
MTAFLLLLFEKGRIGFWASISDFYEKLADELKGHCPRQPGFGEPNFHPKPSKRSWNPFPKRPVKRSYWI